MSEQDQHWHTNQEVNDFNFPDINLQADCLTNCDTYSPNITFTPPLNRPFDFGLDNLNGNSPRNVIGDDSMVLDANALSTSHSLMDNESNHFTRLFHDDRPWNPQEITSHPLATTSHPGFPRFITNKSTIARPPGPLFTGFRAVGTDPESRTAPIQPINSFYGLHDFRGTRSVAGTGTELYDVPQDDTSLFGDLTDAATGMNLNVGQVNSIAHNNDSIPNFQVASDLLSPLSQDTPRSGRSMQFGRFAEHPKRGHYCDIPGCEHQKSFTSSSDLDRHKKAIHNIIPPNGRDKNWKCQAPGCRRSTKIWGRLDNFTNHCRNCHKDENLKDLIKRSVVKIEDTPQLQIDSPGSASLFQSTFLNVPEDKSITNSVKGEASELMSDAPAAELFKQQGDNFRFEVSKASSGLSESNNYFDKFPTSTPFLRAAAEDETDQTTSSLHLISSSMLKSFSSSLLEALSTALKLDESKQEMIQAIINQRIHKLRESVSSNNPSSTGTISAISPVPLIRWHEKHRCEHSGCGKAFKRPCELTKHSKRHARPFFCTFIDCTSKKTFGSKADWKRHENTLHFRQLSYRCSERRRVLHGQQCDKIFHRADPYVAHLKKDHGIRSEREIQQRLRNKEVSPAPLNFWCGYCKEFKPMSTELDEAWNLRFDHIEEHFQEGRSIEEWQPEHDDHVEAQTTAQNMPSKRGSDPDMESILLETRSNDATFDSSLYKELEGHDNHQRHPRAKRPRADESDQQRDWTAPITRNRASQSNQWLSDITDA